MGPKTFDKISDAEPSRHCNENLQLFEEGGNEFLAKIVTEDETWVHCYDPETKLQSMQWKHKGSPPPKKFKVTPSAGKVMATVSWDKDGVLLVEYMEHKKTITGDAYASTLRNLREAIKEKRRGMLTSGVLLLHDNAPVHKCLKSATALKECGFIELNHPPYSPYLAPNDFYLFRNLKSYLRERRFEDDSDVKRAVDGYFAEQEKEFFLKWIESLPVKWKKCVELKGDYIEKQ